MRLFRFKHSNVAKRLVEAQITSPTKHTSLTTSSLYARALKSLANFDFFLLLLIRNQNLSLDWDSVQLAESNTNLPFIGSQ